ncbi:MAG: hypothetical protein K0Q60_4175 [Microvirga sp.]|jgi:hypothetical protein|nr:hypothetical protein [Microvirga sp.]
MPVPRKVKPWRGFPSVNAVHGIRARIRQSGTLQPGYGEYRLSGLGTTAANRVPIGTVPAGAILLPLFRKVEEALTATATITLVDASNTTVYTALAAGVGANTSADVVPEQTAATSMPTADLVLYASLNVALAPAGIVDILVRFYMNKD